ncbi:TIGR01620 family protein [Pseudocolwellia sp. AS88]|uniref:YcjF family protein n=1 Tax=Pseudocolwellia sp. AS88 TaxID=3063958 RepID=UPI0026F25D50|nr:TIGR01620 family protein [Pseudocolwellia sp. AS88]MDO7086089.1 TIGR01620 family protein [Pseudocolwellia sp. AS88]
MIDKYQQQILFDELDNKTPEIQQEPEHQVIFENTDWQPEVEELVENNEIIEKSKPRWLWRIAIVLFLGLVSYELIDFFIQGFEQSPIVSSIYGVLLFIITLIFGSTVYRELSSLRQLSRQDKVRSQVQNILEGESKYDARELCEKITEDLPCDISNETNWSDIVQPEYTDIEVINLYSQEILTSVDQKALDEVAKFSTESVVLIAISPVAIIDMMLIFWRNLRMIDKVAGLYGLKLGYWSRIRLIKHVFINMAYAGASEIISDFGADLLGADLLGKLSGRMAQGLGAGMLTARLGIKTISLCRPVPFQNQPPKLNTIRKKIVMQIKGLLKPA